MQALYLSSTRAPTAPCLVILIFVRSHMESLVNDSTTTADKFFGLSAAYLSAADKLAKHNSVELRSEIDYVGSACMFNARLGVELFLKGMIVLRDPSAKVGTHVLERLAPKFREIYPGNEFNWSIPFTVQVVGGSEQERAEAIRETIRNRPLDQVFLYPTDCKGRAWELLVDFSPSWFNK